MKLSKHELKTLKKLRHDVCIARDGHICLKCKCEESEKKPLFASHIYSVGAHKKMEWDIENCKSLCYRCHILWWHRNPMEAKEWIETVIDSDRLERLRMRSQIRDKKSVDYKLIKIDLENQLKELEDE